jgi:hypothetical protein
MTWPGLEEVSLRGWRRLCLVRSAATHEGGLGLCVGLDPGRLRAWGRWVRQQPRVEAASRVSAAAVRLLERPGAWQMGDHASAGEELTAIVEEHDPVAQQAPALFGMRCYGARGVPVGGRRGWARGNVVACPGPGNGRTGGRSMAVD